MRTISRALIALALAGCGGALDAAYDVASSDAAPSATSTTGGARPIVGTLRMRDRDVPLTTATLDASEHDELRRMTASASAPVIADIDARYVGAGHGGDGAGGIDPTGAALSVPRL